MARKLTPVRSAQRVPRRRGTALVIVLVTITLLALGAATYFELMFTEMRASAARGQAVQTQAWAQSGVQYCAALLSRDGGAWTSDLYNNPTLFHVPMSEDGTGGFTILSPIEDLNAGGEVLRMGMIDECSKLNINYLASMEDTAAARTMLLNIPNMTEAIADSMLDWIDADTTPRDFGAEYDAYDSATPRDGPIDSLEELLLVAGLQPWMLYGEDANRNGVLDYNENDEMASEPYDDGDGLLNLGWAEYLTVRSRESNLRRMPEDPANYGLPKINVNNTDLTALFDELELALGTDAATYIVAYRQFGATVVEGETVVTPTVNESPLNGVTEATGTGDAETDEAIGQAANELANALTGGAEGTTFRNGLDMTVAATTDIKSIFELIGSTVPALIEDVETTLTSPFGGSAEEFPILMDTLTTTDQTVVAGRINVMQARVEVLRAIPDIPPELPDIIVSARASRLNAGTALPDQINSAGWLLVDGLVDLPTMRILDPWVTGRGDVYRVQSVGHADGQGQTCRYEGIIDASGPTPKIIFQREFQLKEMGTGYTLDQLPAFGGAATPGNNVAGGM